MHLTSEHFSVFYRLVTEPGESTVDIKVNIKMSDFDLHLKKMIEKVLKPAGLIFRYKIGSHENFMSRFYV